MTPASSREPNERAVGGCTSPKTSEPRSSVRGAAAIEAAGKLGKMKIVGYDATPDARAKILAGAIYGDLIQHPRKIGQLTIRAIHDHIEGGPPPQSIPVEVGTYTVESPW